MTNRNRSRPRTSRPRPRYVWVPGSDVENAALLTSTNIGDDLLANYQGDVGRDTGPGFVIERVIGNLELRGVAGTLQEFAFGLLVTDEAQANVPNPADEVAAWMYFTNGNATPSASEFATGSFVVDITRREFDVHGRRRLMNVGDELSPVFQNLSSATLTWSIFTRILLRVT